MIHQTATPYTVMTRERENKRDKMRVRASFKCPVYVSLTETLSYNSFISIDRALQSCIEDIGLMPEGAATVKLLEKLLKINSTFEPMGVVSEKVITNDDKEKIKRDVEKLYSLISNYEKDQQVLSDLIHKCITIERQKEQTITSLRNRIKLLEQK